MTDHPSITCPKCRWTSHHPKDISERYCSLCHAFHDDMRETWTPDILELKTIRFALEIACVSHRAPDYLEMFAKVNSLIGG